MPNEQADRVLTEGFAVVPHAVDRDVATELRGALASLLAQQRGADDRADDDNIVHNPMMLDRRFLDLLENPTIIDLLDTFLGPTSILYAYRSSSLPAGGSNDSRRIHVDSPRVIPGYMTNLGVLLALDDFTDDNGATYFLPRSFERADPPSEEEFFAGAQRVHPSRGDLVVFNARTFHSGGVNLTSHDRHAVGMNWCRSFMRQRFDFPRMIGDELGESLSPTLRRVLGFDVRVPTSLDEYYLPADQRLYKADQG